MKSCILFVFVAVLLSACGQNMENSFTGWSFGGGKYIVKRGDTLYSIARRNHQNYQHIASINHIGAPYRVKVGQVLWLKQTAPVKPVMRRTEGSWKMPTFSFPINFSRNKRYHSDWLWPVRGHIVKSFIPLRGQKGIDIVCKRGEQIHASAKGVVVYVGSGFDEYEHLIIIKHDNQYLTAYGHNSSNLVKEGQAVVAGQVIANVGMVNRKYWAVHFEIRRSGKAVNPLNYL